MSKESIFNKRKKGKNKSHILNHEKNKFKSKFKENLDTTPLFCHNLCL